MYRCKQCGSTDVQQKQWVNPNDGSLHDMCSDGDIEDNWCEKCQEHVELTDTWDEEE